MALRTTRNSRPPRVPTLSDLLRQAVADSNRSRASIARAVRYDHEQNLKRFLWGVSDMTLATGEMLLDALDLEVTLKRREK